MKPTRMFRTCANDERKPPFGTLAILDEDNDGNGYFVHVTDAGVRTAMLVKGYEVSPVEHKETGVRRWSTGSVTGMCGVMDMTWHFYKELPVSGDSVTQNVLALNVSPKIKEQ